MSNEIKTTLVAGATGKIGRNVVYQLLATAARVRALTRRRSQ